MKKCDGTRKHHGIRCNHLPNVHLQLPSSAISVIGTAIVMMMLLLLCVGGGDAFRFVVTTPLDRPSNSITSNIRMRISMSSSNSNGGSRADNNNSYDNLPSQDEIAKQKSEAYNALSAFHETTTSLLPMMMTSTTRSSTSSSSQTMIQSLLRGLDDNLSFDDEEENNTA